MEETLGQRLRRVIGDRPHLAIARAAGLSASGLDKLLADRVASPRAETLERLARAVGESPGYLRTGRREREINTLIDLELWVDEVCAELHRHVRHIIEYQTGLGGLK